MVLIVISQDYMHAFGIELLQLGRAVIKDNELMNVFKKIKLGAVFKVHITVLYWITL